MTANDVPEAPRPGTAAPVPEKPPRAKAPAAAPPEAAPPNYEAEPQGSITRRAFFKFLTLSWAHFLVIVGCFGAWFTRYLFPTVRFEPPTRIRVGKPDDFLPGTVDTRFKRQGVWIVRGQDSIYALSTTCTHLGCTPNWLPTEEKFKCPCHGSGFTRDGVNFEGPAPRPLERFQITLDDTGTMVVDKSVVFRQEKAEWERPGAYIQV